MFNVRSFAAALALLVCLPAAHAQVTKLRFLASLLC